jgi:magnesium and cobalt transporter
MNEDRSSSSHGQRSWLERLSQALLGEPEDREALVEMLRDAQQRNLLDAEALDMMEGVMQVSEMPVRDVMIPRSQMVVVKQAWPLPRVLSQVIESGHSRFPVIDEDRDNVVGILIVKDLVRYCAEESAAETFRLRDMLRPARYIPESKRLNVLLSEFRSNRLHMAIVVDEYGGVAGLVTIEDVLEQIVGEIDDEHDEEEEKSIRYIENGKFTIKALTPVEDFNEYFKAQLDEERADTVGGLVMMELGRVPKRGESVTMGRFNFTILHADTRRIHLLELTLPQGPGERPETEPPKLTDS